MVVDRGEASVDLALDSALAAAPGSLVRISLALDGELLTSPEKGDRRVLVDLTRERNLVGISIVEGELSELGCGNFASSALWNLIHADCPREQVAAAIGLSRVVGAGPSGRGVTSENLAYSGLDNREETGTDDLIFSGFDGNAGNRVNEIFEVTIADIENDYSIPHNHVGWCDSSGSCLNRVIVKRTCTSSFCNNVSFASGSTQNHADTVLSTAAGSIEQGQDSAFSGTTDRVKRSGMSKEAALLSYGVDDPEEFERALEDAIDEGADIVNASLQYLPVPCDTTANPGLLNTAISTAIASGVLIVGAAGNAGHLPGTCTIEYPTLRTEILSVGSLDSSQDTTTLPNLLLLSSSARGGMPTTINGSAGTTSAIGVLAPGVRSLTYQPGTGAAAYNSGSVQGTSIAAPVVAGGIADMIDMFVDAGLSSIAHNPRKMRSNVYLLADRASGVGGYFTHETGDLGGYGRFRTYELDDRAFGTT